MRNLQEWHDTVTEHYLTALLWSEVGEDGEPLDDQHGTDDVAGEARAAVRGDVSSFLNLVIDCGDLEALKIIMDSPEQTGHDLCLTRNHHGVGFWDRGYGDAGDVLTKWAHSLGEQHAYVGNDGWVYVD